MRRNDEIRWYSVVTVGGIAFGHDGPDPCRIGRSVSRDYHACCKRADALKRAGCPTARVVECPTRRAAREADIADARYPAVYHA